MELTTNKLSLELDDMTPENLRKLAKSIADKIYIRLITSTLDREELVTIIGKLDNINRMLADKSDDYKRSGNNNTVARMSREEITKLAKKADINWKSIHFRERQQDRQIKMFVKEANKYKQLYFDLLKLCSMDNITIPSKSLEPGKPLIVSLHPDK